MMILVTGGAASGKSAYAESLFESFTGLKYYLATMENVDFESGQRLERHRGMRSGKGFITLEIDDGLEAAISQLYSRDVNVVLEDLGNLVARELFGADGSVRDPDDVIEHIMVNVRMLAKRCKNLVIVANELGGDGVSYDSGTQLYQVVVGSIACALASMSDVVVEVAAGQPRVLKGELS